MYPIVQKIGYTKARECGLWGHCDLIWFFFFFIQHLKTTRIKPSNDWAVIRRQPFIETLLQDTQSAYIHFFSPLLAPLFPPKQQLKMLIWICQTWWRAFFFFLFLPPLITDACPCFVSGLESVWDVCVPSAFSMHVASLSLPPEKHLYSASSLMSAAQASTCFVRNELLLIKNQQKWACNTLCPINILTSSSSN